MASSSYLVAGFDMLLGFCLYGVCVRVESVCLCLRMLSILLLMTSTSVCLHVFPVLSTWMVSGWLLGAWACCACTLGV